MSRPERVLVLRSGRHLRVALDALARRYPGAEFAVVGTSGSERAIEQAGIAPERIFVFAARPRFTPLAFLLSTTARAARRWDADHVAVLWNDPDGAGQGNVDRTALTLAPRGFLAITPDGRMAIRQPGPQVAYEVRRALASAAVSAVLAALYVPAVLWPARRR